MIGYTPNRFRYEVIMPNSPLRPVRTTAWKVQTWGDVTQEVHDFIQTASDPVLEIRIVTVDPLVGDEE